MKKFFYILIISLFQCCSSSRTDSEKIKECFEKYKKAIVNQDGKIGIECVDSKTIAYYDNMIKKIRTSDSIEVEKETPYNKLTILKVRQSAKKESLLTMNGKDLLSYLITQGKAGSSTISEQEIDSIKIENNDATAERFVNGKRTPFAYAFYKEQNEWKLYMAGLIPVHNSGLKYSISQSGLSENEYILKFIEQTSGSKPTNDIWNVLTSK